MAFAIQDDIMGLPPIASTDTVPRTTEGQIVHAVDPVLGGGEFVYLKGAANTVVGSLVTYNQSAHTTTLAPATANLNAPLAVAMSANIANQWGWYQISGLAQVAKAAVALTVDTPCYLAGTGQITGVALAGGQVVNARIAAGAASGVALGAIQINRPHSQGAIT